jgi:hypothetical protein
LDNEEEDDGEEEEGEETGGEKGDERQCEEEENRDEKEARNNAGGRQTLLRVGAEADYKETRWGIARLKKDDNAVCVGTTRSGEPCLARFKEDSKESSGKLDLLR